LGLSDRATITRDVRASRRHLTITVFVNDIIPPTRGREA